MRAIFTEMPVAAASRATMKQILPGEGWMGMREAAFRTRRPRDGDIFLV